MFKKSLLVIVIVMLVIASLGASVVSVFAKTASCPKPILGNWGLVNTGNANFGCEVKISRTVSDDAKYFASLAGVRRLVQVTPVTTGVSKRAFRNITDLYLNLTNEEQRWFKDGRMHLYSYGEGEYHWNKVNAKLVDGRITLRLNDFGTFGVGK